MIVGTVLRFLLLQGLKLRRESNGMLGVEAVEDDEDQQVFGSYKAERLLHFSARSFALAGWGDLEAWTGFYEALLEEFWLAPDKGFVGPSVEDLRHCEAAALKKAVRLVLSTRCAMEDALQAVVACRKALVLCCFYFGLLHYPLKSIYVR